MNQIRVFVIGLAFLAGPVNAKVDPLENEILSHLIPLLKYSNIDPSVESVKVQALGETILELKYSDFRSDGKPQQIEITGNISFVETDKGRVPVKASDIFRVSYEEPGDAQAGEPARVKSLRTTQRVLGFEEIMADEITITRDKETGEILSASSRLPREVAELFNMKSVETLTSFERKKRSEDEALVTMKSIQRVVMKTPKKGTDESEIKEIPGDTIELKVKGSLVVELRSLGNAQDPSLGIEKRKYNKRGQAISTKIYRQKPNEEPVLAIQATTTFNSKGLPERDVLEQTDPELIAKIPEEFRAQVLKVERTTTYGYRKKD